MKNIYIKVVFLISLIGIISFTVKARAARNPVANSKAVVKAGIRGMKDTANLKGTIRTLDGVKGAAKLPAGLLSRAGWLRSK